MKDMINEKLIRLASAQECIINAADVMEQWDSSLLSLEKSAFESMNITDKVLNLSKEGNRLVNRLQSSYRELLAGSKTEDMQKITAMLDEVQGLFKNILETSFAGNEISRNIERETALQKEIGEGLKGCVNKVSESLDSAVACAEFMLAEF